MLKSLFKPYYRKVIAKLRDGLHLDEHTRLLNHIVAQNIELKKDVETLQHELNMLNILVGGIEPAGGNDAFALTPEDSARDLVNILAPRKQNDVEAVQLLNQIDNSTFKGKSICLIGTGNEFMRRELEKRGASQLISIELISLLVKEQHQNKETIYVYPSQVGTVNLPDNIDILFVTHPAASAYLLKRRIFNIGTKITQKGFFILSGTEPERKHLTSLITASGFNQVQEVPNGKTTRFDYMELREVPKHSDSKEHKTVLYEANKMPSVTY